MAEVDTSSYKLPQSGMLDQATKFQQLHQGNLNLQRSDIALGQDKVKQVNDQFQLMNAELASMADPKAGITKDQAAQRLLNLSKTFGFKPEVTSHMLGELQSAPDVPTFAKTGMLRGQEAIAKFNSIYGTVQYPSTGQQIQPVAASPMTGVRPIASPFQIQNPPDTETVDNSPTLPNGQPNPNYGAKRLVGPQAGTAPPGVSVLPGGLPIDNQPRPVQTQRMLPVGKGNLINDGQVTGVDIQDAPATFKDRFSQSGSGGLPTSLPPMYSVGQAAYEKDQQNASQKMMAAKPAIQALPLMQTPGFLSGPLTDQFTKVVAGLKSTGLIDIANENDPTAIRQDVVKKLAQYVSNNPVGQRSDAAQTLREAASPSPNVQILPALIKLTKDAVALDRVEAAMPNAFKGNDYENYIKHKGKFPQNIDEKAFTLDLEPEEKSKALVDKMAKQTKSKNNRERMEAEKFFKSLAIADEQGFYK